MSGPSRRPGAVPEACLRRLLDTVAALVGPQALVDQLVDLPCAAREARRFKLDLSFDLGRAERSARLSINDKGEPVGLRQRATAALPFVAAHLAHSPPGEVQTTFGLKWGPSGLERVSVYFEELVGHPRAEAIRRAMAASVGEVPAALELPLTAVAVDLSPEGRPLAFKDYWMILEQDRPLPGWDAEARAAFPFHPVHRSRRFLWARRHRPGAGTVGTKLLWVPETWRPEDLDRAWAQVERLQPAPGPAGRALAELRRSWAFAPEVFLHPDLVGINQGAEAGVLVYVSVR